MLKLNSKLALAASYAVCALFISGCSNKSNVGYDNQAQDKTTQNNQKQNNNNNDDYHYGSNNNTIDDVLRSKLTGKLSYVNSIISEVNGKKVLLNSVHFAFDKFNLSDEMRTIAKDNFKKINPLVVKNQDIKIKIEGNCDEWGTDEYNYALGLKRAKAAKDVLVNDGISADKIVLVTFGESNPVCSDKTKDCFKQNRRADYRLLP